MDTKIEAAPVVRNADGEYHHPDMPLFYEGEEANYKAWLAAQGLSMQMVWMESDAPALADRHMEGDGDPSAVTDWQPNSPDGEGWFVLAIFDTEDGPVAHFARRWLAAGTTSGA